MRRVDLTSSSTLSELLDLAREENVILKTPEGQEFILAEVDDFESEIEATRQNRELTEFLEQRSRERASYSIHEVRKKLNLG